MPPQQGLTSKSDQIIDGLYDRMIGRGQEGLQGIMEPGGIEAGSQGPAGLPPQPDGLSADSSALPPLNAAANDPAPQQELAQEAQASNAKRVQTATAVDLVKLGDLVNNEQYDKASEQLGDMMFTLGEEAGGDPSGYAPLMPLYNLFKDADYAGVQEVITGALTTAVQNDVLDGSIDSVQRVASAGVPAGNSKKDYDQLIMWGNVIAGVGAGLQGRGGEFLLNLRKRKALDVAASSALRKERREIDKLVLDKRAQELAEGGWTPEGDPVRQEGGAMVQQFVNKRGEIKLEPIDIEGLGSEGTLKQIKYLRDDIFKVTADYRKVNAASKRLESGLKRETAAGDMSAIFNFMKINDPGSTVREGEYATAQNAGGWTDSARNYYNAALDGTRLTGGQRADFLETAKGLTEAQQIASDEATENILQQADMDKIPRGRVFGKERLSKYEERVATRQKSEKSIEGMTDEELRALAAGG